MERESAIINLGNGNKAIVDLEDLPRLSESRWFAEKREGAYYVSRQMTKNGKRQKIYMHNEVMGPSPNGKEIDHINNNGLDNRKENLRFCSHRQNLQARRKKKADATSKYKGVSWNKANKKWLARIADFTSKLKYLGCFESELDAANAYDKAALETFGEFAVVNFPKPAERQDRLFPE